jgi:hypothetical protein
MAHLTLACEVVCRWLVAAGTIRGNLLALNVTISAIGLRVGILQRQWVLEVAPVRSLKSLWRMTILTYVAKVRFGWGMAVGAVIVGFAHAIVAVVAPCLGMFAYQLDGVFKVGIQVHQGPGFAMARRVGAKARIVSAKLDAPMAFFTRVARLESVIGEKACLQVRSGLLNVGQR